MGRRERQEHDDAWGLKFGDPAKIRVVPDPNKIGGVLKGWFSRRKSDTQEYQEHPMSENMVQMFKKQIEEDPSLLTSTDDRGWTLLHQEALAGSASIVKVLLESGADRNALTNNGMTPLQLARSLDWERVVALLETVDD